MYNPIKAAYDRTKQFGEDSKKLYNYMKSDSHELKDIDFKGNLIRNQNKSAAHNRNIIKGMMNTKIPGIKKAGDSASSIYGDTLGLNKVYNKFDKLIFSKEYRDKRDAKHKAKQDLYNESSRQNYSKIKFDKGGEAPTYDESVDNSGLAIETIADIASLKPGASLLKGVLKKGTKSTAKSFIKKTPSEIKKIANEAKLKRALNNKDDVLGLTKKKVDKYTKYTDTRLTNKAAKEIDTPIVTNKFTDRIKSVSDNVVNKVKEVGSKLSTKYNINKNIKGTSNKVDSILNETTDTPTIAAKLKTVIAKMKPSTGDNQLQALANEYKVLEDKVTKIIKSKKLKSTDPDRYASYKKLLEDEKAKIAKELNKYSKKKGLDKTIETKKVIDKDKTITELDKKSGYKAPKQIKEPGLLSKTGGVIARNPKKTLGGLSTIGILLTGLSTKSDSGEDSGEILSSIKKITSAEKEKLSKEYNSIVEKQTVLSELDREKLNIIQEKINIYTEVETIDDTVSNQDIKRLKIEKLKQDIQLLESTEKDLLRSEYIAYLETLGYDDTIKQDYIEKYDKKYNINQEVEVKEDQPKEHKGKRKGKKKDPITKDLIKKGKTNVKSSYKTRITPKAKSAEDMTRKEYGNLMNG